MFYMQKTFSSGSVSLAQLVKLVSHKHEALSLDPTALVTGNSSRGRDGIKRRLDLTGDGDIESGVREKRRGGRERIFFKTQSLLFTLSSMHGSSPRYDPGVAHV